MCHWCFAVRLAIKQIISLYNYRGSQIATAYIFDNHIVMLNTKKIGCFIINERNVFVVLSYKQFNKKELVIREELISWSQRCAYKLHKILWSKQQWAMTRSTNRIDKLYINRHLIWLLCNLERQFVGVYWTTV